MTATQNSRGPHGGAHVDIRFDETIDDAAGTPVLQFRIDCRQMDSLALDVWTETNSLDVALRRLVGYEADGGEIWQDVVASASIAAAADENAVNPSTEITTLYSNTIRSGIYGVFACRTADPNDGVLHVHGHAKS